MTFVTVALLAALPVTEVPPCEERAREKESNRLTLRESGSGEWTVIVIAIDIRRRWVCECVLLPCVVRVTT